MNIYKYTLPALIGALIASLVTAQIINKRHAATAGMEPPAATRPAAPVKTDSERDSTADELARLMEENAELRAELIAARSVVIEHDAKLKLAAEQLEELRRPMTADILSSTLRAELRSGEVVVTGGYKLADGRRLYAFAKPVIQEIDGTPVAMVHGRYVTVTDEVGKTVGLDSLVTNAANTLQHGEVWVPAEEESVLKQLEATPGTAIRALPSFSVRFGRSGTMSIGETQLKVTPTLADGVDNLGMELRLEQPQESGEAAPEAAEAVN